MKLVDILARELKVWPEGVTALQQGGITGWLRDENFNEIKPRIHVDLADDRGYPDSPAGFGSSPSPEWVSRRQWQAAVDALKATEAPAWVGVGLPPVGTVCEIEQSGEWNRVEVMYLSSCTLLLKFDVDEEGDNEGAYDPRDPDIKLRPIRTPEQIAAEERTNNAIAMCQVTQGAHDWMEAFRMLHDAGYRKFEIVES